MIDYLVLPEGIMSHETVKVPDLENPICLNFVIIKGVHDMPQCSDTCLVYDDFPEDLCAPPLGVAKIFDIKHMVLGDLLRYPNMCKYFHDKRYRKARTLRNHLDNLYDGLIDGEIVTLVFFTPGEGLLDGTTTTPENSQSTKQA